MNLIKKYGTIQNLINSGNIKGVKNGGADLFRSQEIFKTDHEIIHESQLTLGKFDQDRLITFLTNKGITNYNKLTLKLLQARKMCEEKIADKNVAPN